MTPSLTAAQERPQGRPDAREGGQFFYGLGLMASSQIYRDDTSQFIPIPLLGYRSERLNVFGPFATYKLFGDRALDVSVQLAPNFNGFSSDDGAVFTGMETRKWSVDAGASVSYRIDGWGLTSRFLADILGRSNGVQFEGQVDYTVRNAGWLITPAVGATYQTKNYVDYYYGVRASEATAVRAQYTGRGTLVPFVDLSLIRRMSWASLRLNFQNKWHGSGITDSPLVRKKTSQSLFITLSREF